MKIKAEIYSRKIMILGVAHCHEGNCSDISVMAPTLGSGVVRIQLRDYDCSALIKIYTELHPFQ